jgi:hypothetical protein
MKEIIIAILLIIWFITFIIIVISLFGLVFLTIWDEDNIFFSIPKLLINKL